MGSIQNSLNSVTGTFAAGMTMAKYSESQAELKQKEIGEAETIMTEAALTNAGVSPKEAKAFAASEALGLKMSDPSYQARYNELKAIKADQVLGSETYAKMKQSARVRAKILQYSGSELGEVLNGGRD